MALFADIEWADGTLATWPADDRWLRCATDTFLNDFQSSSYWTALRTHFEDLSPGPSAGTTGVIVRASDPSKAMITDADIFDALRAGLEGEALAYSESTVFAVIVPPGVPVLAPWGARSDDPAHGFGGYHGLSASNAGAVNYCVIIAVEDIDELTYRLSHEIAEQTMNPDGHGWFSDPNATVNRSLGLPVDNIAEICDYTANPESAVQVHGWSVASFAYDAETTIDGYKHDDAPGNDTVPRTKSDRVRVDLDKGLTAVSCLGRVLEGQEAYLTASASHLDIPQVIASFHWSSTSKGTQAVEVNGNQTRTYVLAIPEGCASVHIACEVVMARLGCAANVYQDFEVASLSQADQDTRVCELISRLKQEQWFDPFWWLKFDPRALEEVAADVRAMVAQAGVSQEVGQLVVAIIIDDLKARLDGMIDGFRSQPRHSRHGSLLAGPRRGRDGLLSGVTSLDTVS